jgi:hypothetical protein
MTRRSKTFIAAAVGAAIARLFGRSVPLVGISIGLHQSPRETRVSNSVIRLLILAIHATALVRVPMVTPAKAATSSNEEIEKNKIQNSPGVSDPPSSPVWPPPMYGDADRKTSGRGGI